MCECGYVYLKACAHCGQRYQILLAGVIGDCELPDMGAVNLICINCWASSPDFSF